MFKLFRRLKECARKRTIRHNIILCVLFLNLIYRTYVYMELFSFTNERFSPQTSNKPLIYILQWNSPDKPIYLGKGQYAFYKTNCKYKNCFVTSNRSLLKKITMFNIITFNGKLISHKPSLALPKKRGIDQKYIFLSTESAYNNPVCNKRYNHFFNLTWTYKLDSNWPYYYVIVKNKTGHIIGPSPVMHWMDVKDMKPIGEDIKLKLMLKSRAAACFVSNCVGRRMKLLEDIRMNLKSVGYDVHIYGGCGSLSCSKGKMTHCYEKIQKFYYFFFAFENSIASDYVTEKLIHGLNNYAVPVVYGGANYTRFMPNGIYLDAVQLEPRRLAKEMYLLIKDRDRYYDMFRWHNHYSYIRNWETKETNPECRMCALANSHWMEKTTEYPDFVHWWNEFNCTTVRRKKQESQTQKEALMRAKKNVIF